MAVRHIDSLVARGNTSDVYAWGRDSVVKVLREGIPARWAIEEARNTEMVHAAGLPAPAVREVTTVAGRPAIVFERITGVPMWEHMLARPADIPQLAGLLADLQGEVSATPAPSGFGSVRARLRRHIECAPLLTNSERAAALADLGALQDDAWLCHFDVHPNNVLMASSGPMIIDWFDAAAGSPAADVVRTSALMRNDAADGHLPCVRRATITRAHDHYVASVLQRRNVSAEELRAWEGPILAARLAERIDSVITRAIVAAWRRARTSHGSALTAVLETEASGAQPNRTGSPGNALFS